MSAERAPDEFPGITHHFQLTVKCVKCERRGVLRIDCSRCAGQGVYDVDGYIMVGCDETQKVRHVSLTIGKIGDRYTVYSSLCTVFNALLTHVTLKVACSLLIGVQNEMSGSTANKTIPRCSSIEDYLGRFLLVRFGDDEDKARMRALAGGES